MNKIHVYSGLTLEHWNEKTPLVRGIGGSEKSHLSIVNELRKLFPSVESYIPLPPEDTNNSLHKNFTELDFSQPGVYIIYRDADIFDKITLRKDQRIWFIAQDVDYNWNDERLAKVDRYITLCKEHSKYTLEKYPSLRGKVFQSSNGITPKKESVYMWGGEPSIKDYNTIFYPSSPDRGLKFILENWFRIKEINPQAKLRVAYGFENMDIIIEKMRGNDWRTNYKKELEKLLTQKDITFLGRLNNSQLQDEWSRAGIWFYPCTFAETSCITCLEAQQYEAIPVCNDLWALNDNVKFRDFMVAGDVNNPLIRSMILNKLEEAFVYGPVAKGILKLNSEKIEKLYSWENIAKQWKTWIDKDMKGCE